MSGLNNPITYYLKKRELVIQYIVELINIYIFYTF